MTSYPDTMFTLSKKRGSFGLDCNAQGLALAGVPLLRRAEKGFVSRPMEEVQWLIDRAYQTKVDATPLIGGLDAVARALSGNEMVRAMIAAILLKLPELDWDGAVRIAQADDMLSKYDPDEPRDRRGRWAGSGTRDAAPAAVGRNIPGIPSVVNGPSRSDGSIVPISDQGKPLRNYDQCISDCTDLTLGASKLPPGSSDDREWEFRRCVNTCLGIGEPWPQWVPLFPPQRSTPAPHSVPSTGPSPWWVIPLLPFPGNPLYGGV